MKGDAARRLAVPAWNLPDELPRPAVADSDNPVPARDGELFSVRAKRHTVRFRLLLDSQRLDPAEPREDVPLLAAKVFRAFVEPFERAAQVIRREFVVGQGNALKVGSSATLIGRAALVLQHHAPFATKDVDFVRLSAPLEAKAAELFGKNSAKAQELDFYLEFVPDGLPPLPGGFQSRSTQVNGDWQVIRPWVLEPNDLAVTKMKSFRSQDRQDLKYLCDRGVLQVDKLRESMDKAWMWTTEKDGDEMRDRAFANLEKVIAYLEGRSRTL